MQRGEECSLNRTERKSEAIELATLYGIERAYTEALSDVLEKHDRTLKKLEELEGKGEYHRARVLVRTSGMLDDLSQAIAQAGIVSVKLVREGNDRIRDEVLYENHSEDA